jgi:hypothetical protein
VQPAAHSRTRLSGRQLRLARWIYVAGLVCLLALFLARLPIQLHSLASGRLGLQFTYGQAGEASVNAFAMFLTLLDVFLVLGFCAPALLIFWRRSDDWLAMYASLVLVMFAIMAGSNTLRYVGFPSLLPLWLAGMGVMSFLYKVSALILLFIFPTGRFVPRWTRYLVPLDVIWAFIWGLPAPLSPWTWPYYLGNILDSAIYATGIYAQIYRYRRVSTLHERQQTKWVIFGMAVAFITLYAYKVPLAKFPMLQEPTPLRFRFQLIGQPLAYLALLSVPVTMTISILRYRLYDIDVILNRTLVYVPLTAIVAGIVAACISLSQKLFVSLTDQQSIAATVLTTLFVVAAFTPIKDRLQKAVDRHFKEAPDPGKRLTAFAGQVQARLFAADAAQMACRLLEESIIAFGATSGAVYLTDNGDLNLVRSTRTWQGQVHLSAPLRSGQGDTRLGQITLGARRNGSDYTGRDRALLESAAQAVALAIEQDRELGSGERGCG